MIPLIFSGFSNVCYSALKLGCITNFDFKCLSISSVSSQILSRMYHYSSEKWVSYLKLVH